ncbi:hypothetical protein H4Q26_013694 [Puccinia striiformis f. sp. tritici PST-130]|nr:hypothetical protein H4Q26_013694 [Puccinia striiformis f. sp. tritici PST-130]
MRTLMTELSSLNAHESTNHHLRQITKGRNITMANEMTLKEQLANIPKLIGDDNYPMWHKRMRAFLRHKELFDVVTNDPGPNPAARVKKQLSEAANILVNKIDDKLCTSIVTDDNDNNGDDQ